MTQERMLEVFCNYSKDYIEDLDIEGVKSELADIQFDRMGPCCSDYKLVKAFMNNCSLLENEIYFLLEMICSEYCENI